MSLDSPAATLLREARFECRSRFVRKGLCVKVFVCKRIVCKVFVCKRGCGCV